MKVVLLSPGAKIPKRADEYAAGYDVFTPKDVTIKPGRNVVKLDIAIELNPKTEGNMRPRSGFSVNGMEGVSIRDNALGSAGKAFKFGTFRNMK